METANILPETKLSAIKLLSDLHFYKGSNKENVYKEEN